MMTETVTLVADANDMTDMVNLQYRAAFYLGMGYGAVYIGPDVLPDGTEVANTFREDLVQSFDEHKIQGFTPDDTTGLPVIPTIKNPSIELQGLADAIGDGPQDPEVPDEDEDEDEEYDWSHRCSA